jgi:hypothetical protein
VGPVQVFPDQPGPMARFWLEKFLLVALLSLLNGLLCGDVSKTNSIFIIAGLNK